METEKELETRHAKLDTNGRRRVWLTRYLPLFVWIGVIFFLSSSQGSMNQTSRIIRPLLEFFFPGATPETLTLYHGIIRKFAHVTEYAVLGILACRALAVSVLGQYAFIFAALLVVAVAAIDETNQSFNPARTGSPVDVLIDVSGGIVAIVLFYLLTRKRTSSS